MSTTQPEALRLAHIFDHPLPPEWPDMVAAAAELRRQHAEIAHADRYAEQLGRELAKATAEIADLRARLVAIGAGGVSPLMGAAGDAGRQATIALEMLVAVGLVTQAKVDEAMSHAARITPPSSDKGVAHG